jgi:hypothetical protein
LTASQKVHLRRCASSFLTAAYFFVRLIPRDSRALHLELFTVPSTLVTFYEVILSRVSGQKEKLPVSWQLPNENMKDYSVMFRSLSIALAPLVFT